MPRERPLAYDVKHTPAPYGIRHEAIFTCFGCGKRAVLHIGDVHNPEKLANRLKKHGWLGSAWCPRRDVLCPECIRSVVQVPAETAIVDSGGQVRMFDGKPVPPVPEGQEYKVMFRPRLPDGGFYPTAVFVSHTLTFSERQDKNVLAMPPAEARVDPATAIEWAYANRDALEAQLRIKIVGPRRPTPDNPDRP